MPQRLMRFVAGFGWHHASKALVRLPQQEPRDCYLFGFSCTSPFCTRCHLEERWLACVVVIMVWVSKGYSVVKAFTCPDPSGLPGLLAEKSRQHFALLYGETGRVFGQLLSCGLYRVAVLFVVHFTSQRSRSSFRTYRPMDYVYLNWTQSGRNCYDERRSQGRLL